MRRTERHELDVVTRLEQVERHQTSHSPPKRVAGDDDGLFLRHRKFLQLLLNPPFEVIVKEPIEGTLKPPVDTVLANGIQILHPVL